MDTVSVGCSGCGICANAVDSVSAGWATALCSTELLLLEGLEEDLVATAEISTKKSCEHSIKTCNNDSVSKRKQNT